MLLAGAVISWCGWAIAEEGSTPGSTESGKMLLTDDPGGREAIDRLNMGVTVRVYGKHALGIQYVASLRDARYPDQPDSYQSVGTISLVYTLLGDIGFGAVEWRNGETRSAL